MTEQVPDVTFVIAAFKAEETIDRAIESALAQTGVMVEVVVIDDCSPDGTAEIVAANPDPRIRLLRLGRNRGPGGARNAGLAVARGSWIAILDADDAVRPERAARMIEKARQDNAQIVVDNLDVVSLDGSSERMFAEAHLQATGELRLPDFIESNSLFRSTHNYGYMKPIFARRFLAWHGLVFDESLPIGEDYLLLASALAKGGRCAIEPSAGYIYHIRSGSISRVLKLHHVEAMMAADATFLRTHPLDADARLAQARRQRSIEEARSFVILVDQLKSGSFRGALQTAWSNPAAVGHLRMPIALRLRRLAAPLSQIRVFSALQRLMARPPGQ